MGLKTGDGQYSGQAEPIRLRIGKIQEITDISGTNPYKPDNDPWDVGVKVTLAFTAHRGDPWTKDIFVGGMVEWDLNGKEMVDWGKTGWRLKEFFRSLGIRFGSTMIPEITERKIPLVALRYATNKSVMTLSYVTEANPNKENAYWYNMWDTMHGILDLNDKEEINRIETRLTESFHKSISNGYPRNYNPDIIVPVEKASDALPGAPAAAEDTGDTDGPPSPPMDDSYLNQFEDDAPPF